MSTKSTFRINQAAVFLAAIIIGLLMYFSFRGRGVPQPTSQQQNAVVVPSPTPAFEYEKYDKVFGISGPKAVFFTNLFDGGYTIGMYNDLKKLANKGVLRFTVRYLPGSSGLWPDPQRVGEKLVTGFTNCVKLLYPENYTNYLITLQSSYTVPSFRTFGEPKDFSSSLKSNLPNDLRPGVTKCIQENSYSDIANKETDYINKVNIPGSPELYFPDLDKHITGYIDSDYFISQLWDIMDLSSFGYKKIDVQQQIKDLVQ